MTLALRAASTCSLSFDNLSIDIDLRFIESTRDWCVKYQLRRDWLENQFDGEPRHVAPEAVYTAELVIERCPIVRSPAYRGPHKARASQAFNLSLDLGAAPAADN